MSNTNKRDFNERWFIDGIKDDYTLWAGRKFKADIPFSNYIFVESPTGTGKTTFILKNLFPFAAKNHRNILYLGNRTALNDQLFSDAKSEYDAYKEINTKLWGEVCKETKFVQYSESHSKLYLINYQSFFSFKNTKGEKTLQDIFDYVILDEAHFFLEDSLFNPATGKLFEAILTTFANSVVIFMSATLSDFADIALEKRYLIQFPKNLGVLDVFLNKSCIFYSNLYRPANYQPIYYSKNDEIVERIKLSHKDEKWLIFTNSKEAGRNLKFKIQSLQNRTVAFVSSSEKHKKTWDKITSNSCFNEDVLITTKVLDNGINIHDTNLKHIVIPFCHRTEFLQMLGRKRCQNKEDVLVYVQHPSIQVINAHLRRIKQLKSILMRVHSVLFQQKQLKQVLIEKTTINKEKNRLYQEMTQILIELWEKKDKSIDSLFYLNKKRDLVPNDLALCQIILLENFYDSLKKDLQYIKYHNVINSWLNIPQTPFLRHASCPNFTNLYDFLEYHLGEEIYKNEQEKFYQQFLLLYTDYCSDKYATEPQKLKEVLSVHKEKSRRKATINRCLALIEDPLKVTKKNNAWILQVIK